MRKSIVDLSWNVSEPEYRQDPAISQSLLARYSREGFSCLSHLDEKEESDSLTFGSAVDAIITGGMDEFESRFIVSEVPDIGDSMKNVVESAFSRFSPFGYGTLSAIPEQDFIAFLDDIGYCARMSNAKRIERVLPSNPYYEFLFKTADKQILSSDMANDVSACVTMLQTSQNTTDIFGTITNPDIERAYQLKFKHVYNDVPFKGMLDCVIVDHANKIVYQYDLKTSSHKEYEFYKAFEKWGYRFQACLYYKLLVDAMLSDPYYHDFTVAPFTFVVINKKSLCPLLWQYSSCTDDTEVMTLGKQIHHAIVNNLQVPEEISLTGINNIEDFITGNK